MSEYKRNIYFTYYSATARGSLTSTILRGTIEHESLDYVWIKVDKKYYNGQPKPFLDPWPVRRTDITHRY